MRMSRKKDYSKMSEGEMVEAVLDLLPPEGQFALGMIMGVMQKEYSTRKTKLEQRIGELERECNTLRSFTREEAIAGDGKG
jgi:hypothetical protein